MFEVHIPPLDAQAMQQARERQAKLAKPPGSLGVLEDISVRFAGITGRMFNDAKKRRVLIFSADNGVVAEGVSSSPQSVTLAQTINFGRGLTGVAVLAKHYNTQLRVYDVGINADFSQPGVINKKIAHGTRNLAVEPAMTRAQALEALEIGMQAAADAANEGIEILGVGEMGIGNTTTSSAILSCHADFKCLQCLIAGHCRLNRQVARTVSYFFVDDPGLRKVCIDTHVVDAQLRIEMLSQHGHTRQSAAEVDGLGQRHRLRRG